ncbi:MAG: hypothetical protein MJ238_06385 [Bacilli bacterium]|nr:hypothetical protein [Bacilli bacterium]
MAEKIIRDEEIVVEEKEPFLVINKETLKRPGIILRLIGIALCLIGVVLTVILPTVVMEYRSYSSASTFDPVRGAAFPQQIIGGPNALFGGGYFALYLKSADTPHLLTTVRASFNPILFTILACMLVFAVLSFFVTFSKKMEKMAKLATLGIALGGFGAIASPIWFMVANNFGNNYLVESTNITEYFMYDSLYCHSAWGAIVAALVFVVGASCFGIGTNLENKGGERGQ